MGSGIWVLVEVLNLTTTRVKRKMAEQKYFSKKLGSPGIVVQASCPSYLGG
jgi:hypothetical protein